MKRRVYSDVFKSEAIEMCKVPGASKSGIAKSLGININTLYSWLKDEFSDPDGLSYSNKSMEKELLRLRLEVLILKKAIGIFTKGLPEDTVR